MGYIELHVSCRLYWTGANVRRDARLGIVFYLHAVLQKTKNIKS